MDAGWRNGRQTLAGLLLAAVAGIGLAEFLTFRWWLPVLGMAVLIWVASRTTLALLAMAVCAFAILHGLQFQQNSGRVLAEALKEKRILVEGEGIVSSIPTERISEPRGNTVGSFEMRVVATDIAGLTHPRDLRSLVSWPGPAPSYGSRVRFSGSLTNARSPRNPGEFDYAGWLARRQIFSQLNISQPRDAVVIEPGSWSLIGLASRMRSWMEERLSLDLENDPKIAAVITAMVLGTTNDNLDDLKIKLQETGTLHLFAVSGLQVTMLGAIILFVLQTLRVPRRAAVLLTIPLILFYALITGWSASSVRAALMTSFFLVAILLDRPVFNLNTLAASALIILAADTNQLFNTGFQLSYSVVFAIILLARSVKNFLQKVGEPDPFLPRKLLTIQQKVRWRIVQGFSGTCGLTIAAWLGSMPFTIWYFHLFSPVALLANLWVVPISFLILVLGIFSVALSCTGNWLTILFNNANWLVVHLMLWSIELFASLPAGFLHLGARWIEFSQEYRITVLDLGPGASTVIETPSRCWLIDTGSEIGYQRIVRPFLQSRGINRLDGIFLTHGDSSHVGGVREASRDFAQPALYLPAAGTNSLVFRRLNLPKIARILQTGDHVPLDGNATAEILFPNSTTDRGRADDNAMVVRLLVFGRSLLLTSDSGFATEAELPAASVASDILVMGRNRDDLTGTSDFLGKVRPQLLICSAASFPTVEEVPAHWGEYCQRNGTHFFPQNATGAVEILINPERGAATGFLNKETCKLP